MDIYIYTVDIDLLILVWLKLVATKMVEEFRTRETITRETSNQWVCFPDAPCMESLPLGNMWVTYPLIRANVGQYSIHGAYGFHYPLVSCYWKRLIEIVDLPSYKMVDLSSSFFVNVYQGLIPWVSLGSSEKRASSSDSFWRPSSWRWEWPPRGRSVCRLWCNHLHLAASAGE